MDTATLFLLSAILIAALAATAWRAHRRRRRAILERTPLLIGEAMAKRGVYPADAEAAGLESEVAVAVRRCETCANTGQCRDWIAGGPRRGNSDFCPNAALFDEIEARRRAEAERPARVLPFT